jgi:hypothetical protein
VAQAKFHCEKLQFRLGTEFSLGVGLDRKNGGIN